ncbi:hypothetical protein ACJX0J_034879, partial [Zea mays]
NENESNPVFSWWASSHSLNGGSIIKIYKCLKSLFRGTKLDYSVFIILLVFVLSLHDYCITVYQLQEMAVLPSISNDLYAESTIHIAKSVHTQDQQHYAQLILINNITHDHTYVIIALFFPCINGG